MHSFRSFVSLVLYATISIGTTWAADPLSDQIDRLVAASGQPAVPASDAEFCRRIFLDLAGKIPTAQQVRAFLEDTSPQKRRVLIDHLLASEDYPQRMQSAFSVMLLERRSDSTIEDAAWETYLRDSFQQNKPLDQLVREIVSSNGDDPDTRPAMKFFLSRSPSDHKLLALEVGRLFLGKNLACAQCHDHPYINEYEQSEFFGLVAFLDRSYLYQDKQTNTAFFAEKGVGSKLEFTSVFTAETGTTGPRLKGRDEVDVPMFEQGDELERVAADGQPPLPKFPLRVRLAEQMTDPEYRAFARNMANRLWAMMFGAGLVTPLDMHHADNPPTHPELLDLLTESLISSGFDAKQFLRELALTEGYQASRRSMEQTESATVAVSFQLKGLSPEQLALSMMRATGVEQRILVEPADSAVTATYRPDKGHPIPAQNLDNIFKLFCSVFAAPKGEPEDNFRPSVAGALFLENEPLLLDWLQPRENSLIAQLEKLSDPGEIANDLYLAVLSRMPTDDESQAVAKYLNSNADGKVAALQEIAWALLASSEFRMNH